MLHPIFFIWHGRLVQDRASRGVVVVQRLMAPDGVRVGQPHDVVLGEGIRQRQREHAAGGVEVLEEEPAAYGAVAVGVARRRRGDAVDLAVRDAEEGAVEEGEPRERAPSRTRSAKEGSRLRTRPRSSGWKSAQDEQCRAATVQD